MPGVSGLAGDSAATAAAFLPLPFALAGVFAFLGDGDLAFAAVRPPPRLAGGAFVSSAAASGVFGLVGETAVFFPPLRALAGVLALAGVGGHRRFIFFTLLRGFELTNCNSS